LRGETVIETVSPAGQDALTRRYTEEALAFIREHQAGPFFLYLPHTAVHLPLHPGQEFQGKSAHGPYGDWVQEVDWNVGRVLDTLRDLKIGQQTLVIFSSDNGAQLRTGRSGGTSGPLRGGKAGTYEGGIRVPTLAWWPGSIAPGTTSDAIAGNYDLLPTFVALAGGTVPKNRKIDGCDLSGLLLGHTKESPHEALYFFSGSELHAVRSGPWKYAVTRLSEGFGGPKIPDPAAPFTPTLWNLDEDIGERHDVAASHPDVVARMKELVARMDADLGRKDDGPGVRPPGRVPPHPGLWLPGQTPVE
jgi:arylsulfatase A-like enzyme